MTWEESIRWAVSALKAAGLSNNTIRNYQSDLRYISKIVGKNPDELTKLDINQFILVCQERGLKHRSINRRLIALKSCFDHLVNVGLIPENQFRAIRNLKEEKDKTRTYLSVHQTEEVEQLLLTYPYGERHAFCMTFMTRMGLRISEVVNLDVLDFDLEKWILMVRGKGNKVRPLPIPTDLRPAIEAHLEKRTQQIGADEPHFFYGRSGKRLSTRTMQHWFTKAVRQIYPNMKKLPVKRRFTPHKLRHSFAMHAIKAGTDILTLQAILGHESIQTTTIYAEAADHLVREAMENHPMRKSVVAQT